MKQPQFDVAIVGGGMVGAVLAVALEQAGLRIALVEANEPPQWQFGPEYDLRVSAISPASRHLLTRLGLWEQIQAGRVSPYRGMRVWERAGGAQLEFEHSALGLPELGHIVENNLIVTAAWNRLASVRHFCPALLEVLDVDEQAAIITLDTGEQLTASLVVGAEGAQSAVRQLSGIDSHGWRYGQRCTVGTVSTQRSHQAIAWQRFLPTGPVAFLPLADGRCSLAWHADEPLADELQALDDTAFCERLTRASDGILGEVLRVHARAAFPLQLQHAKAYVKPRIALIGDAAHVLHPMAGQGVNLGMLDIATLTDVLCRARQAGRDPGDVTVLRRYQRPRRAENLLMLGVVDGIQKLFAGGESGLLAELRNQGLSMVDRFAPLKHLLIRQAAGFSGSSPPLLRDPALH